VNSILITISIVKYIIFNYFSDANIIYYFLVYFFTYLVRNYLMLVILSISIRHKKFIHQENNSNNSNYQLSSHLYMISSTLIDSIFNLLINIYLIDDLSYSIDSVIYGILYFIPKSFIFEIVLDFFHYWSHRICHIYKYLYRTIHKTHHTHHEPVMINTYYFSQMDSIMTVSIPTVLAIYLTPYNFSLFEYVMLSVYKQYTELAGHSGKKLSPSSSFPQCVWLPKILNIELYSEDHNMHHNLNNCNYSKRFSLWDKIFGTYKKYIATN